MRHSPAQTSQPLPKQGLFQAWLNQPPWTRLETSHVQLYIYEKMPIQFQNFFQWLWWRSADPIGDALPGRRQDKGCPDMLKALGTLRRDLRYIVGDEALKRYGAKWYEAWAHTHMKTLPIFGSRLQHKTVEVRNRRLSQKVQTTHFRSQMSFSDFRNQCENV